MVKITLRVTGMRRLLVGLKKFRANLPVATDKSMLGYAQRLKNRMKQIVSTEAIYHTDYKNPAGKLSEKFFIYKVSKGYNVVNIHPGATALDIGAVSHVIVPKNTRYLRLHDGGYAKVVQHPGVIRPMRFSERAINETKESFRADMQNKIEQEARRYFK